MSRCNFDFNRYMVSRMIIWLSVITLPSISQAQHSSLSQIEHPHSVYKEISVPFNINSSRSDQKILRLPQTSESKIILAKLVFPDNKMKIEEAPDQSGALRSDEPVQSTALLSDRDGPEEVCASLDFTRIHLTRSSEHDLDEPAREKLGYCTEHELRNYRAIIAELIGSHVKLGYSALGTRDYAQARWHLNRVKTLKQAYNVRSIDSRSLAEKISMMSKRQKPRIFGNF